MKFFGTVRQESFDKKSWHNSLKHKIFRYPKLVTHTEGFPYKIFRHCETKSFWQIIVILPPPPPLIHKFFRYQKFCETKKGSPTKFFGTVRQQIFYRKSWYSPLSHKVFRHPKFSETQTGSSTKFFGTVRQKIFNGKLWYPFAKSTEISGEIDVCKNSLKTNNKTVVLFLTVCKSWSKYL